MKKKEIIATLAVVGTIVGTASHHSAPAYSNNVNNSNNSPKDIMLLANQNNNEIGQIVNTSFLHFRSGPSTNDTIISTLNQNQTMIVLGKTGDWYKVNVNGTIGYVYAYYINIKNSTPVQSNQTIQIGNLANTTFLHLRASNSINSDILETLNENSHIIVLGTDGSWYKVDVNGTVGYVYSYYLSISNQTITTPQPQPSNTSNSTANTYIGTGHLVNTTFLHFRSEATVDSNIISTLNNQSDINVIAKLSNGWYEINVNGQTGYVDGYYLEVVNSGSSTDSAKPSEPIKKVINTSNTELGVGHLINTTFLHFRTGPSVYSDIIDTIYPNDTIKVLSKDGAWYKIEVRGETGYVYGYYLNVTPTTNTNSTPQTNRPNPKQNNSTNEFLGVGHLINTSFLHFRSGATLDSDVISTLEEGAQTINVIKKVGSWYEVNVNGQVGYVYAYYLSVSNSNATNSTNSNSTTNINNNNSTNSTTTTKPETSTSSNKRIAGIGTGSLINTTFLHLRANASTNSDIVETLYTNDKITVLSKDGSWYKVICKGVTGYVYGYYINVNYNKPTSSVDNPTNNTNTNPSSSITLGVVVNSPYLHVRSGASTNFSILEDIYRGDKVEVLNKVGSWYEIKINGKIGYVYDYYINIVSGSIDNNSSDSNSTPTTPSSTNEKVELGQVVNVSSLNIRSNPTTNSKILGTLNKGNTINIVGAKSGWYKIQFNSSYAYVSSNYIQIASPYSGDSGSSTTGISDLDATGTINSYLVNILANATDSSGVIGQETINSPVNIIGEKNGYYEVKLGNNYGFIDKDDITITKNLSNNNSASNNNSSTSSSSGTVAANTITTNYPISLNDYVNLEYNNWPLYTKQEFLNAINPKAINNMFEFLRINQFRAVNLQLLNNLLNGKGVLSGQGQAFVDACQQYNIDPVYFVNQSILETGYGRSRLAKGVTISEIAIQSQPIYNSNGQLVGYQMQKLPKPVTVYNLFGIGAEDNSSVFPNRALILGTTYAYTHGWTSIPSAIAGAAEFVSDGYIHNNYYNQNTVYKLRFSPKISSIWHQYCTNIWYAKMLGDLMKEHSNLYLSGDKFTYDIPTFQV